MDLSVFSDLCGNTLLRHVRFIAFDFNLYEEDCDTC